MSSIMIATLSTSVLGPTLGYHRSTINSDKHVNDFDDAIHSKSQLSDAFYLLFEGSEPLKEPVHKASPFGAIASHFQYNSYTNWAVSTITAGSVHPHAPPFSPFASQMDQTHNVATTTFHALPFMSRKRTSTQSQSLLPAIPQYSAYWLSIPNVTAADDNFSLPLADHNNADDALSFPVATSQPQPRAAGLKGLARLRTLAPEPLDLSFNQAATKPEESVEITTDTPNTPPNVDTSSYTCTDSASPPTSSNGAPASHDFPKASDIVDVTSAMTSDSTKADMPASVDVASASLNPFDALISSQQQPMDEATRLSVIKSIPKPMPGDDMTKWMTRMQRRAYSDSCANGNASEGNSVMPSFAEIVASGTRRRIARRKQAEMLLSVLAGQNKVNV